MEVELDLIVGGVEVEPQVDNLAITLINRELTNTFLADIRATTGSGDYGNRLVVAGGGGGMGYLGGGGKGMYA